MKIVSALEDHNFASHPGSLGIILYGHSSKADIGDAGAAIEDTLRRRMFHPTPRAWDFLSVALTVMAADLAGHRDLSPDGWTRVFELEISVVDPSFLVVPGAGARTFARVSHHRSLAVTVHRRRLPAGAGAGDCPPRGRLHRPPVRRAG